MKNIFIIIIATALLSSCATIVTKYDSSEKFQISAWEDKKSDRPVAQFLIKKDLKNNIFGEFTSTFILPAILTGAFVEDESGDVTFYISKIDFTTSWPNGWTFGEYEASGIIKFNKAEKGYISEVLEPVEFWELKNGEIRYFDDYYIKEEGLKKVKDRMDRIEAIVNYLKSVEDVKLPDIFGNVWFSTRYSVEFKPLVKKILFDKERKFPDELEKLRETETLLRDWEESCELIYMKYNFDYFFENILNNYTFFHKIKL
ncbi:MAG: hypothetical protein KA885_07635 [Spirochaetes bacterium]|nr:hypothetical protein [Spirochaetota bacterium]